MRAARRFGRARLDQRSSSQQGGSDANLRENTVVFSEPRLRPEMIKNMPVQGRHPR